MTKLLIVDDEALARRDLCERIEKLGADYAVVGQAKDGQQALDAIDRLKPDVVLLDLKMPVMNGLEVLFRAHALRQQSTFVVMSCFDDYTLVRQAMKLGAADYLLKHSCTKADIASAIENAQKQAAIAKQTAELKRSIVAHLLGEMLSCSISEADLEGWAEPGILADHKVGWLVASMTDAETAAVEAIRLGAMAVSSGSMLLAMAEPDTLDVKALSQAVCQGDGDDHIWLCDNLSAHTFYAHYRKMKTGEETPDCIGFKSKSAMDYVRDHISEKLTLEIVADALELSRVYLSQVFKKETGVNFSEWFLEYRLKRACALLLNTNMKIYEIADSIGFSGQSAFSVSFKKRFGISPYAFRERIGEAAE